MGIRTPVELDARLLSIRSSWDEAQAEAAYTADVTALARDLDVAVGCDSLLKVALVGLQPSSPPDTPAVAAPAGGFAGCSVVLATAPTRLDELAAGWGDDEVHTLLLESCLADVTAEANQAELLQIYLAFLARSDVRRQVGADRPVDLHVLAALTAERAAASMLSPVTLERDVEVALYRWLWGLLGASEPVEHVGEVLARRDLRLQVQGQPVAVAAAKLSEVPAVTLLPFDASTDRLADPPLTLVDVRASARDLSRRSAAWAGRLRGLEQGERGDQAGNPYVMSGRALRWLLDRGVPIGAMRLGRIDDYAKSVVELLARRADELEPLGAHMNVVLGLAEDGVHLPLAEELAVLAWLCDEYDAFVDLAVFLDVRDRALTGDFG